MNEERKVAWASTAADVGDAAQEAFAVTPSAHAGQQRAGDVLEGEVEVRHPGGQHRLDQLVGQPGRVQVEQPGAVDPGRDGAGQGGDGRPAGLRPAQPGRERSRP